MDNTAAGIFFFLLIISLSLLAWIIDTSVKQRLPKKDHFYKRLIHLAGHPYLTSNDMVDIDIVDNKICLTKINKKTKGPEYAEDILPRQIITAEIKNEKEISESVTLPRVIMLGVLSLAAKKKLQKIITI